MSCYNNFVSDFPERCAQLLKRSERTARLRKGEVTVVPLDRCTRERKTLKACCCLHGFESPKGIEYFYTLVGSALRAA